MKTVLIIEDDPVLRETIQDLLRMEGFCTITAIDGSTGIRLATEHLPDLILCDIQMPGIDGYQVLSTLQQTPATIPIPFIFLTAKKNRTDQRHGMNLGADDYLTKPFSRTELIQAIASRIARQNTLQAVSQQQLDTLRSSITLSLPHELRTPLTGILTTAEFLRSTDLPREEVIELANTIHSSAKRLYRLIENFLVYAQIEIAAHDPDRLEASRMQVTLNPQLLIANRARGHAQKVGRAADLRLNLQNAAVMFPAVELERAIEELIDNAFKFSSPGSPVSITSIVQEDKYTVEITDAGRGMTAEQIAKVGAYMQFDRHFYEQQGTGLGLTIAKRLVELHAGTFSVRSIPDQTTITIGLNRSFQGGKAKG